MDDETQRDFLAISERDIFTEAKDRLQQVIDAESKDRQLAKDDAEFREGDGQWDHNVVTTASENPIELTINFTDVLCTRVSNNIKSQRPRGKCHPVSDGAKLEIADVMNGVGRHVEYRSTASIAYDHAADEAITGGWGYFRIFPEWVAPDSDDQDLRIAPIFNTLAVYMDPDALMPTGSDSAYCLVVSVMKRTEYKRRYPRAINTSFAAGDMEWAGDWEDAENIRLAEYFRIREIPAKLLRLRDATGQESNKYASDVDLQLLNASGTIAISERMSYKRQVEWFRLNGTKVVERQILPGNYIPIIRVAGNTRVIDGQVRRRGMVRNMKDPARMVNYGEVAKIRRLGLTPQAPWVAAEGQLDGHPEWTDSNQTTTVALIYKPVTVQTDQGEVVLPPPSRQPPAGLEQGFAEFTNTMKSNLLAVAGMPNDPGQDTQGEVVSGKAIQRRQGMSDQSHMQYYDNLTLGIAHCWKIMLEWIPYYYSGQRLQRIIGEDGLPQMVQLNQPVNEDGVSSIKNDLSVGRYDVVMDTGPGYDTKREEGSDAMLQLLGTPLGEEIAKVGPDLIIRSIDHPYMQELADRFAAMTPEGLEKIMAELPERAKAIVQSLGNQNKQLKDQLQKVEADLKYGITKAHLAATTAAHDTEESNKTKRMDTKSRDSTRLAVESLAGHFKLADREIAVGGSLLNTHVEAEHNAKAADKAIETAEQAERAN